MLLKFLHFFLPAWNLGFLFYYFSLSYYYKIVNCLQTSAFYHIPQSVRARHWVPPCSGFGIRHCSGMPRRGQHSAAQRHWMPSPTGYPGSGDTDSTKHHQLSPDSADTVQNPCPMRSGGPHRTFILLFFLFWLHWVFVAVCGLSCSRAYEILVPQPGVEPESTALEGGFLPTGPLEKSLGPFILKLRPSPPAHLAVYWEVTELMSISCLPTQQGFHSDSASLQNSQCLCFSPFQGLSHLWPMTAPNY